MSTALFSKKNMHVDSTSSQFQPVGLAHEKQHYRTLRYAHEKQH